MKIKSGLVKIFSLAIVAAAALTSNAWAAEPKDIDIVASDYGYGDYVVKARGVGFAGAYDEDLVVFHYYPVVVDVTEGEEYGDYNVDFQYNADEGTDEETGEETGEVAKIIVNIYNENGDLVREMSPIDVLPPTTHIELHFAEAGVPYGKYAISATAYNRDGEKLYKPYVVWIDYEALPVPDTGSFFQNLNISKTDYLITGLIVFSVVAVLGFVFVKRSNKKQSRLNSRRKR